MSLVEKRYAEALVDIAFVQDAPALYQTELEFATELYTEQAGFKDFLLSPEVKAASKQAALQNIFSGRLRPEIVNFLMLLVEKGRIAYLPEICREFVSLADERRNILHLTILTPFPLDEVQINKITGKYGALYKASSVKAEVKLDSSLIGGVKIVIGDKVIDGTAAGRLKALREVLVK